MIILYGFGPGFGLPECSPYVTKTEVHLKMAGLAYDKRLTMPQASPKGQLPFIDDRGQIIADSTFIRAHLERVYGIDFDAGLTPLERATAWALERMIENQLGWTMTHARWIIQSNFDKGPARFFDDVPEPAREQLRTQTQGRVADALRAVGVGRHTPDEIVELGLRSLAALSLHLGDKPYLMGARPTGVDAVAFGMLAGVLTPFFDSPLRQVAEPFEVLGDYVERMMARFYPEHAWTAARAVDLNPAEPAYVM